LLVLSRSFMSHLSNSPVLRILIIIV
jgi:hypothetical protein